MKFLKKVNTCEHPFFEGAPYFVQGAPLHLARWGLRDTLPGTWDDGSEEEQLYGDDDVGD